jgi:hypothetical protein
MEYYESLETDMEHLSKLSDYNHTILDKTELLMSKTSKKKKLTVYYEALVHTRDHYKKLCDECRADYLILSPRRKEIEKILTDAGEIEWSTA